MMKKVKPIHNLDLNKIFSKEEVKLTRYLKDMIDNEVQKVSSVKELKRYLNDLVSLNLIPDCYKNKTTEIKIYCVQQGYFIDELLKEVSSKSNMTRLRSELLKNGYLPDNFPLINKDDPIIHNKDIFYIPFYHENIDNKKLYTFFTDIDSLLYLPIATDSVSFRPPEDYIFIYLKQMTVALDNFDWLGRFFNRSILEKMNRHDPLFECVQNTYKELGKTLEMNELLNNKERRLILDKESNHDFREAKTDLKLK